MKLSTDPKKWSVSYKWNWGNSTTPVTIFRTYRRGALDFRFCCSILPVWIGPFVTPHIWEERLPLEELKRHVYNKL